VRALNLYLVKKEERGPKNVQNQQRRKLCCAYARVRALVLWLVLVLVPVHTPYLMSITAALLTWLINSDSRHSSSSICRVYLFAQNDERVFECTIR